MRLSSDPSAAHSPSSPPLAPDSSLSPLHKAARSSSTNGTGPANSATNGSAHPTTNGAKGVERRVADYYGHDREEVTRILIQSLHDLGYSNAAATLGRESGFELESATVAAFRNAVLHGEWGEAEGLLFGPESTDEERDGERNGGVALQNGHGPMGAGFVLAPGADRKEMLFLMREQKFLELLEKRDLGSALMVLRQELTPLHQDTAKLHGLSCLIMCQSAEDLKYQAEWDGAAGQSRRKLLTELSTSISPSVMISDHRLATLLDQVKQNQISNCMYHNTATSPSLYSDHLCDRGQFPQRTVLELDRHADEVWFLEFSHDGSLLATTGRDRKVIIYDVASFEVLHTLYEHEDGVTYVAWSPDDTKLVSCSQDRRARLWDVQSGRLLLTIDHHSLPVTTCSWAPDGQTFVTGSHDLASALCLWNVTGDRLHGWSGEFRVQDCSITPDGSRLVAISTPTEKKIFVYDLKSREEEYSMVLKVDLTCVSITRDSRFMLINRADNEVQLLDIGTGEVARRFLGQKQGNFVIRSRLGGAAENFVISGSEDSRIYIWHKENGTLVETLEGHKSGCVNAVSWSPTDPCMFASAGDDHKVRIWSNGTAPSGRWNRGTNGFAR
ncbi:MAG: hypothetical protein M1838_002123 [Thelocarpon superellum]|nr:MAG: hypothetical protein M1838_002123 [Thelocarpon superellum]